MLDEELEQRQKLAARYTLLLNEAGVKATPQVEAYNVSAWAQYTVRVPVRDQIQKVLSEAGVPTAVHYPIPLNKQPAVADAHVSLPVGDEIASQVVSLPMSPNLTEADQDRVVAAFKGALS